MSLALPKILLVLSMALTAGEPSLGQQSQNSADGLARDYSQELPRIEPLSPQSALNAFQVASGFRIEQVAAEPLVVDPVAMAFDERGRLFVVEMRGYSENELDQLSRVRLLEDSDADGRFDKSSIFLDNLGWATAIACYDGGVFVGVAPDILYAKDNDGDGHADSTRVVVEGFHRSNVQGLLNSFTWGLDNRLHGATSGSGAEIVSTAHPDSQPLVLRGRDFALEPRRLTVEPTSGGGQHGLSFDPWGTKFVCSNSDHIQLVMFEDRYAARNPYLAAPAPRVSIAADGPQADVFRTSPVEPWRIVRTRLRKKGIVPGVVEGGGRAAGYFTSATGITIYTGNAWPESLYGYAIIGDVGGNLIHRKRLEPAGVGYVAHRVDANTEFVTSRDIWFRPVQFANGPDGSLYVADMYREVIEHPASLHPIIKQHLDLTSGRDRGRIYRIIPEGFEQPALPRLDAMTAAELVEVLDHANGWHRQTAARLLFERQDRAAVGPAEELVRTGKRPEGRIRALYALDGMGALAPDIILAALADPHPRVREQAVRLAEKLAPAAPEVRSALYGRTADEDPKVRYQLAFSLGECGPQPQRNRALAAIAKSDGDDPYVRFAILSSCAVGAGGVMAQIVEDPKFRDSENGRALLEALAAQIGKQQRPEDVVSVIAVLSALPAGEQQTLQAIIRGLSLKEGSPLQQQVAAATGGLADDLLANIVQQAQAIAADPQAPAGDRVSATHQLRLGQFVSLADLFAELLQPNQPAEVQQAALAALASFEDLEVAALLLDQWGGLTPALRSQAGDVLASREPWLHELLKAVHEGRIAPGDLQPGRLQLLAEHADQKIRDSARTLLSQSRSGSRAEVVAAYEDVISMPGDASRGREVFKRVCAACHQVEGTGHAIGPNLVTMRNRGPESIVVNVLDPNREVNPEFLNYILVTADGRTLSGMIAAETATGLTLKRAENASDTVLRIDIEEMRSTGMSLMPEGLEKDLDKQALADLLAYLSSIEQ